jgi:Domain of unknown function (DUF397)
MSLGEDSSSSLGWRKALRSMANGNCVEVQTSNGSVAVRDSQNPVGGVLAYDNASWQVFTQAARAGRFDVTG